MASNATNRVLNIDANGLLDIGCRYAGTLYMHKSSKWKDKWVPRFVIIARGWIYIFQDKNAKKADKRYPLHDFMRVDSDNHVLGETFCFCLLFSNRQKKEPLSFACETEEAKQTWMKHLDEVLKSINGSSADSDYESITGEGRNSSSDTTLILPGNQPAIVEVDRSGYLRAKQAKYLTGRRVSERTEPMSGAEKCNQFVEAAEFEQADIGNYSEYITKHNSNQATEYRTVNEKRPLPLPDKQSSQTYSQDALLRNKIDPAILNRIQGEPSDTNSQSFLDITGDSVSNASFPISSRKSKSVGNKTFIWEHPSTAESQLKDQPVGNFLVCPGKESTWLLLVKSQQDISKIPIHTNEENQTLSLGTNNSRFRSLEELIEFYQLNKVPLEDADMVLKECGNIFYNSCSVEAYV